MVISAARVFRVTSLPLTLPWASGIVMVSTVRTDFPTAMETHLLRVAVSQAAIAIHTRCPHDDRKAGAVDAHFHRLFDRHVIARGGSIAAARHQDFANPRAL